MKSLGLAIKTYRKSVGKKQIELAEEIGLSQTSLSQIERGVTMPHAKTIESICIVLNTSVSTMIIQSIDDKELINEISRRVSKRNL